MNRVTVDQTLRARLNGLDQQTTFADESGKPLGMFLPLDVYKRLLASVEIPLGKGEIERRRKETGGCTLDEFWKRMERA